MLKKTNWKHFYLLLNGRKNKRKLPDLTALCQLTLCRIDISGGKIEEELFKMYKQCKKQTKWSKMDEKQRGCRIDDFLIMGAAAPDTVWMKSSCAVMAKVCGKFTLAGYEEEKAPGSLCLNRSSFR